jgi:hypothetical protein
MPETRDRDPASPEPADNGPERSDQGEDERPPILGSWRALYWLLIGALVLQIGLYALLTQVYS